MEGAAPAGGLLEGSFLDLCVDFILPACLDDQDDAADEREGKQEERGDPDDLPPVISPSCEAPDQRVNDAGDDKDLSDDAGDPAAEQADDEDGTYENDDHGHGLPDML